MDTDVAADCAAESPLRQQSRPPARLVHPSRLAIRSLSGVKRTWAVALQMSAYDPKRTLSLRMGFSGEDALTGGQKNGTMHTANCLKISKQLGETNETAAAIPNSHD